MWLPKVFGEVTFGEVTFGEVTFGEVTFGEVTGEAEFRSKMIRERARLRQKA
jgi:hypothetical protein